MNDAEVAVTAKYLAEQPDFIREHVAKLTVRVRMLYGPAEESLLNLWYAGFRTAGVSNETIRRLNLLRKPEGQTFRRYIEHLRHSKDPVVLRVALLILQPVKSSPMFDRDDLVVLILSEALANL